jgi:hypothetical protein
MGCYSNVCQVHFSSKEEVSFFPTKLWTPTQDPFAETREFLEADTDDFLNKFDELTTLTKLEDDTPLRILSIKVGLSAFLAKPEEPATEKSRRWETTNERANRMKEVRLKKVMSQTLGELE